MSDPSYTSTPPVTNVLIGCTGSVASLKIPNIVNLFYTSVKPKFAVKVMATDHAKQFFDLEDIPSDVPVLSDADEWSAWTGRGDPVLHIELNRWADVLVLAPLDANSMAKIASGICDNLLLCAVRAWTMSKPLYFCPAMNTKMWDHPITAQQIRCLTSWGYKEIPCIAKTLICGDTGLGAMAEVDTIFNMVVSNL